VAHETPEGEKKTRLQSYLPQQLKTPSPDLSRIVEPLLSFGDLVLQASGHDSSVNIARRARKFGVLGFF
jgi:hypothetical protein